MKLFPSLALTLTLSSIITAPKAVYAEPVKAESSAILQPHLRVLGLKDQIGSSNSLYASRKSFSRRLSSIGASPTGVMWLWMLSTIPFKMMSTSQQISFVHMMFKREGVEKNFGLRYFVLGAANQGLNILNIAFSVATIMGPGKSLPGRIKTLLGFSALKSFLSFLKGACQDLAIFLSRDKIEEISKTMFMNSEEIGQDNREVDDNRLEIFEDPGNLENIEGAFLSICTLASG